MFVHFFAFRWNKLASDEDRARTTADILDFNGRVPGLTDLHIGENVSLKSADYHLAGVMLFEDQAAFNAYQHDERHMRLLEWLVPLIDAVEFDFTGSSRLSNRG